MQPLQLKCLKNKGELIANVANARHVAHQVMYDMYAILDDIETINRAILFEDLNVLKVTSEKLRLGQRDRFVSYVDGFEELITTINTTTAKCSKAKVVLV